MSDLVNAFKELVPANFVLSREGGLWIVSETKAGNDKLEIGGVASHAFALDGASRGKVFPFFSNALKGMQSVNDAIIVATVGEEHYVIGVELKTSNSGDALKQIESGRLFVSWVRELLRFYKHWSGGQYYFFGIVSMKPRKQIRKGLTTRGGGAELPDPIKPHGTVLFPYFVLKNHPKINIQDFVKKLKAAYPRGLEAVV